MKKVEKHKLLKQIRIDGHNIYTGTQVDAIRVNAKYYKVFHAIGWLKVPVDYFEDPCDSNCKSCNFEDDCPENF